MMLKEMKSRLEESKRNCEDLRELVLQSSTEIDKIAEDFVMVTEGGEHSLSDFLLIYLKVEVDCGFLYVKRKV